MQKRPYRVTVALTVSRHGAGGGACRIGRAPRCKQYSHVHIISFYPPRCTRYAQDHITYYCYYEVSRCIDAMYLPFCLLPWSGQDVEAANATQAAAQSRLCDTHGGATLHGIDYCAYCIWPSASWRATCIYSCTSIVCLDAMFLPACLLPLCRQDVEAANATQAVQSQRRHDRVTPWRWLRRLTHAAVVYVLLRRGWRDLLQPGLAEVGKHRNTRVVSRSLFPTSG